MKNISKLQIVILAFAGLVLTNCHPKSKNLISESYSGPISEKLNVQKSDTATAQKDTYSDYQKFIKDAYSQLDQNEITILKLQRESDGVGEELIVNDHTEIEGLKNSNKSLKMQLDEYVLNGSGNWQSFETEFCNGLWELEIACNNSMIKTKL